MIFPETGTYPRINPRAGFGSCWRERAHADHCYRLCYRLLALCCFGLALGNVAAFGADRHSVPRPPAFRDRLVVIGVTLQRHYWDPRCAAFCPWTPARLRFCPPDRIYP